MKWIRRVSVAMVIFACGLGSYAVSTALRTERPVGFQIAQATDTDGRPFVVAVWYPTEAHPWPMMLGSLLMNVARDAPISGRNLPLVVISHGNGAGPGSHADLAFALAAAGYVVAAPTHTGDNYSGQSAVGSELFFNRRTRQLHMTVDYMHKTWSASVVAFFETNLKDP